MVSSLGQVDGDSRTPYTPGVTSGILHITTSVRLSISFPNGLANPPCEVCGNEDAEYVFLAGSVHTG